MRKIAYFNKIYLLKGERSEHLIDEVNFVFSQNTHIGG